MAEHLAPDTPLIAETGGLNAMIVDSTALPEQAVRDIVTSAFQSAGQRCSARRILYVQREVEVRILEMLFGAMDELRVGDPWDLVTDVGPVIDDEARERVGSYCRHAERDGRLLKRLSAPVKGRFVPPTVLRVDGIESLEEEIFGPVLHVATFDADRIDAVVDAVVDAVNAAGYGLTFGLHTRIDDRVQHIEEVIPRQWKVIQTVREKFTCRDCEKLSQPPGAVPRGTTRLGGSEPARHHRVREVRAASAAEPPERTLRQGGCRAQHLDAGRPGGRVRRGAATAARADCDACAGGPASAR